MPLAGFLSGGGNFFTPLLTGFALALLSTAGALALLAGLVFAFAAACKLGTQSRRPGGQPARTTHVLLHKGDDMIHMIGQGVRWGSRGSRRAGRDRARPKPSANWD